MPRRPKEIVGLDFETYHDKDYTLKKMSTSEYIRDPRFEIQSVAIQTNRQRAPRWYPGYKAKAILSKFKWDRVGLLAHHAHFDGLILSHHFGVVPAYYYDTLSMARVLFSHAIGASLDEVAKFLGYKGKTKAGALDAVKGIRLADMPPALLTKLGSYNADDVGDMWRIFRDMLEGFPETELDLIDVTVRMFADPVLYVDKPRAEKELERERRARKRLFREAGKIIGVEGRGAELVENTRAILSSDQQFVECLRDLGIEPPHKKNKKGKLIPATAKNDAAFQKMHVGAPKEIKKVIDARLSAKSSIGVTRAESLLQRVSGRGWRVPVYLNYGKAHTLRWTGGDKLNPQNFPAGRKGQSAELRKSLIAPKGYVLVVADSSQIEDRTNCWVSEQNDVLELYRQKKDVYAALASEIYKRPIDKKRDKQERDVGKVARLGLGYSMGADKFRLTLLTGSMGPAIDIPIKDARTAVKVYRQQNRQIKGFWKFMGEMLQLMLDGGEYDFGIAQFHPDGVDMPNGLTLHYPELQKNGRNFEYWNGKYFTKIYGGLFTENFIQCLARIIVAEQMLHIAERYRVVMMTHDEVVYLAPRREANKALEFGLECLRTPPDWCPDIPLDAEGGWAKNYSK